MTHVYTKKLAGTLLLSAILATAALAASSETFAKFVNFGSYYTADGVVIAVGASSLTVDTGGSQPPFLLQVNGDTRFAKNATLADVYPGDGVTAKFYNQGGSFFAQTIKIDDDGSDGYGQGGKRVYVQWAYVKGKTSNTFTVEIRPGVFTTFAVNTDTTFKNLGVHTLADLRVNDTVEVQGTDDGLSFTAQNVNLQQRASGIDIFSKGKKK